MPIKRVYSHKRLIGAASGIALTAFATTYITYSLHRRNSAFSGTEKATRSKMTITHPFRTLFAVPMTCESCVKDVSDALYKTPGILKVDVSLEKQSVSIEGTAPPSTIVKTIQSTGRDAILRGSGSTNSAAVSILETYHELGGQERLGNAEPKERHVRGLARMVQVAPAATVIDLTVQGVTPGVYHASIREYGNLKDGVASVGPVWAEQRGYLGTIEVGPDGHGDAFLDQKFEVWEVIGHALVVSPSDESKGAMLQNNVDTVVGVIARSAGVWDNDKMVCSCTGKTLWDERKDEIRKGLVV